MGARGGKCTNGSILPKYGSHIWYFPYNLLPNRLGRAFRSNKEAEEDRKPYNNACSSVRHMESVSLATQDTPPTLP